MACCERISRLVVDGCYGEKINGARWHDSAFLGALPVVVAAREREIEAARVLKCREVKDTSGGEKEKRGWDIECPGERFLWGSRSMGPTGTVPRWTLHDLTSASSSEFSVRARKPTSAI